MASKDVFNAHKSGSTMLMAFINTVGQEIGTERTIGLVSKMCENMGAMQGKLIKGQAGIKKFDAKTAGQAMKPAVEKFGVSGKAVEKTQQKFLVRMGRCPNFEAAADLKVDAKAIEVMCNATCVKWGDAFVKQLDPGLSFRQRKARSTASDFCEHEIILV